MPASSLADWAWATRCGPRSTFSHRAGTVIVGELNLAVVGWNRGPLGPPAGHPLDDPRVSIDLGDVANVIRRERRALRRHPARCRQRPRCPHPAYERLALLTCWPRRRASGCKAPRRLRRLVSRWGTVVRRPPKRGRFEPENAHCPRPRRRQRTQASRYLSGGRASAGGLSGHSCPARTRLTSSKVITRPSFTVGRPVSSSQPNSGPPARSPSPLRTSHPDGIAECPRPVTCNGLRLPVQV